MPRESLAAKRGRVAQILEGLARTYPDAHCELVFKNPLQLLIATILSAHYDKQVILSPSLFKNTDQHPIMPRSAEELGRIYAHRLFRSKARNIENAGNSLIATLGKSSRPWTISSIWMVSVAKQPMSCWAMPLVLMSIVVYPRQALAMRLGWSQASTPEKVELDLIKSSIPENGPCSAIG